MQRRQRASIPAFVVLQDSNFRTIWYVTILGELSRRMEMLILAWFILQETESVLNLALIMVFHHLPRPFLSMPAGIIADRFNRHHILLAARSLNILTASSIFILIVSDTIQPWHALAAPFVYGIAQSFEDPSRRTSIFDIVGQGRIVNAMSLEMVANTSGKLAGPILAGGFTQPGGLHWGLQLGIVGPSDRAGIIGLGEDPPLPGEYQGRAALE